ncbi:MAG: PaaI family thioesterase [Pyrinomonadaceae bacterium]
MKEIELSAEKLERVREAFQKVPFARLLGLEIGEARHGEATIYLNLREDLKQNNGVVHGGAIASLVDTAAAFAILTVLEAGQTTTTVDLTIHYMRPLVKGRVAARATVLRAGRRMITVSVEVRDEAETLVTTALTTYIRLS